MSTAWIVAGVLALALALGIVRSLHPLHARRSMRIGLQVVVAILLCLCLLPPSTHEDFTTDELVVLTPGATPAQVAALQASATVIALPGSPARRDAEVVPDLAAGLRRHPERRRLRIVGGGLPARDRDAARGLVAGYDEAPLPRGLVELDLPASVQAGNQWRVRGRVEGVAPGRIELRDPGDVVVAAQALDNGGHFTLQAQAKAAGHVLFSLRVLDHDGVRVEDIPLPLVASEGEALKVLLLAGAPDPELKYLRRWAMDAGIAIDSRIAMSEGMALTEGMATLDAEALRKADLVIVDERAWAALDATAKSALHAAVRDGLGLLLRITGPVAAPVAVDWTALGFTLRPGEAASPVALAHSLGLDEGAMTFTRHGVDVDAGDAAPLLRADDGAMLALWRAQGQGRVALWWLADSWKLALGGGRAPFASLWSSTFTTLARAHASPMPQLPPIARVGERAILCNIKAGYVIEDEGGQRVGLLPDGAATAGCAGYWPTQPGWHTLVSGTPDARWPFLVRAEHEAASLRHADDVRATRDLVGGAGGTAPTHAVRAKPLPRWPFFLAWLALTAVLWWLERPAVQAKVEADQVT